MSEAIDDRFDAAAGKVDQNLVRVQTVRVRHRSTQRLAIKQSLYMHSHQTRNWVDRM
jgi:hypothetical protein